MSYQPAQSPWDVVNNPPEQVQEYFGEISVSAWWCMLASGQGKLPYDERVIDPKTGKSPRRYTAIDLTITPLPESNLQFDVTRSMLAEFGDWKEITWPSLRDLGITEASTLNNKFARVEVVPTGKNYTNANGEERPLTAIKFAAVYDTREQCLTAMNNGNPQPIQPASQPAQNGNGNKERETAQKFLKVIVQNAMRQSGRDVVKARDSLVTMIANNPLLAKFFTVDSPEVIEMMTAEMATF